MKQIQQITIYKNHLLHLLNLLKSIVWSALFTALGQRTSCLFVIFVVRRNMEKYHE